MQIEDRLEAAKSHLAAGRGDSAAVLYESVLDISPGNVTALRALSLLKLSAGDADTAFRLARNAAARAARDPETLTVLARVAQLTNRPEIAAVVLDQALAVDPHYPAAVIQRADEHFRKNEPAAAETLMRSAIQDNPASAELLAALAGLYSGACAYASALDFAQKALAAAPERPEFIAQLGSILASLGDHAKAVGLFERAHLLQPENPLFMVQLADAQGAVGETTSARRLAKRAVTLFPSFLPAWVCYVRLMTLHGEGHHALAEFLPVAGKHPDKIAAVVALAICYRGVGDPRQAMRLLQPVLAQPDRLDAVARAQAAALLRDCLISLGRIDEVPVTFPELDVRAVLGLPEKQSDEVSKSEDEALISGALGSAAFIASSNLSSLEILALLRFSFRNDGPTDIFIPSPLREIAGIVDHVRVRTFEPGQRITYEKGPLLPLSAILALPPKLRGDVEAPIPYVSAPEEKRALWRRSLADFPRPLVALAWNPHRPGLLLEDYRAVFDAFSGTLISLMWDNSHQQLKSWREVVDAGVHFKSLEDVTAVIAEVDGVLGPDGIALHLAGAMGRPGALLTMPNAPWYWHQQGGRAVWYPTIEVVQPKSFGHWELLLPTLKQEIEGFIEAACRRGSRPTGPDQAPEPIESRRKAR